MKYLGFLFSFTLLFLYPLTAFSQTCVQAGLSHPLQATLTWVDQSTDETGFVIERKLNAGAYAQLTTVATNTVSALDTTVVRSTVPNTYTYRLKAVKFVDPTSTLESAYSAEACITFAPNPPSPPNAPAGFTVSQNSASPSDSLTLSWDDQTTESSYEVVGRPANGNRAFIKLASLPADTTNWDWTGLRSHTSYCSRVRALNAKGASGYSPIACNTTSR